MIEKSGSEKIESGKVESRHRLQEPRETGVEKCLSAYAP